MQMGAYLRRLLSRAEVDRAVVMGLTATIIRVASGPLTALAIAWRFSPVLQGYYYTFRSLLAAQVLVELGLGQVVIQFASHEWAHLQFDSEGHINGEHQALVRLASLGRFAATWYAVCAILVLFGLIAGGFAFFGHVAHGGVLWTQPWLLLCVLTALDLVLVPCWALLEGCNQVSQVYGYRAAEALITSLAIYAGILAGAGLWALALGTLAKLGCESFYLLRRFRGFFASLFLAASTYERVALHGLWAMQWRIALSWGGGYLAFGIFSPILFKYQGPVESGQFGMTWQIVGALGLISSIWAVARAPLFGILIEKRQYEELDALLFRIIAAATAINTIGALVVWSLIYFLYRDHSIYAVRVLPPLPSAIFIASNVINQATVPLAVYLRAHRREPLAGVSLGLGLGVAVASWYLAHYSVTAVATGYFCINALIVSPIVVLIWFRCRSEWHREPTAEPSAAAPFANQNA